jgi:hypothetical protein
MVSAQKLIQIQIQIQIQMQTCVRELRGQPELQKPVCIKGPCDCPGCDGHRMTTLAQSQAVLCGFPSHPSGYVPPVATAPYSTINPGPETHTLVVCSCLLVHRCHSQRWPVPLLPRPPILECRRVSVHLC